MAKKRIEPMIAWADDDFGPDNPTGFLVGDKALWDTEDGARTVRIYRIYESNGTIVASVVVEHDPSQDPDDEYEYQTIARVDALRKWDDPEGKARLLEDNKPTPAQTAAANILEAFTGSQEALW